MADFTSKITITAIDKVSTTVSKISASLNRLMNTSLKTRTADIGKSFNNLGNATSNFGNKLRGTILEVSAVAGSLFYLSKRAADTGEELLNAAQKAGVAVDQLQKLRYAAKIGGVDISDMDTALKFLNKSIAEAGTNKKSEQAKAFKSMGLSVKDASGKFKSASTLMLEMSDIFSKTPDGAKKVTTAFTLMGRGGTNMIPILNEGSANFKKLGAEAERLGTILTEDQAKKLDAYGDNVQRLEMTIGGLSNRIILALIPAFTKISNSMLDYIVKNKEILAINIAENIKKFGESLVKVWEGLKIVIDTISPLISALGGLKTVVIALSTLYLSGLIISFVNVGIAIGGLAKAFALLSLTFLANPFGIVIAGLGLIAVGAYKLYKIFPELRNIFVQSIDGIKAAIGNFIGALLSPFAPLIASFNVILGVINSIKNALSSMPSPSVQIGVGSSIPGQPAALQGTRFAPISQNSPSNSASGNITENPAATGRFGMLQNSQVKQKLDINMKIDAEGRPKDVKASSNSPINFSANTGLMMP